MFGEVVKKTFTIKFRHWHFDEFLFITGDHSRWLIMKRWDVITFFCK